MTRSKALMVILLAVVLGCAAGWVTFKWMYWVEITHFDRSVFDNSPDCWGTTAILSIQVKDGEMVYSGGLNSKPSALEFSSREELEENVLRLAANDSGQTVCLTVSEDVPVAEILWLESLARNAELTGAKLLIRYPADEPRDEKFRDLRLRPRQALGWYLHEWYVDREKAARQNDE